MKACIVVAASLAIAAMLPRAAVAADMTAAQSATAKWMVSQSKAWADQACGGKWVVSELFADDFKGTAPKGSRYQKPSGEPAYDPNIKWSTECSLDEADVRFFGEDVAVVYGAESKTVALADGKSERRCLAWTDTWHMRNGKWQIIAAQDNRIECRQNETLASK